MTEWGVPELRSDRLATVIPIAVYGGGPIHDPTDMLFLWRSCATERASGATLAFYVDREC
jgi:hypothetical protein